MTFFSSYYSYTVQKRGDSMKKQIKTKRKLKFGYKILFSSLIALSSFLFIFHLLYNKFLVKLDNETLISHLVDYNLNTKKTHNIFYDIVNLNSTNFLLKYTLGVDTLQEDHEELVSGIEADYIEDPYDVKVNEPILYIYNTHQTEGYQKSNNASYNITPSVLMASYILRESLNDLGIPSMVETNDIAELLRVHNWKYSYSYAASKILLEDAIKKNPGLTYFIDIHRDAMSYDITTTTIGDKKYAKVLFVIGKDNPEYEKNLKMAESINEYIKGINPNLTRGISQKGGSGVNGIYNQNISPNAILIELGGQYNNITEVNNTLNILAEAIYHYVKGE